MVIIGIDPGQHCGLAVCKDGLLRELHTVAPFELVDWLKMQRVVAYEADVRGDSLCLVFEDSRLQSYVWNASGKSRADGALRIARNLGQVDALCSMVQEWATVHGVPFIGVSPKAKGAKMDAATFASLTGWTGRSNQHERDAASLAWRYRCLRNAPRNTLKHAHKAQSQAGCYCHSAEAQNAPKREIDGKNGVQEECGDCERRGLCAATTCRCRKTRKVAA